MSARTVQIQRRHFTIEDYHRMHAAGILGEDDRVELVEGEIVEMSPIGSRDAACVRRLVRLLGQQIGADAIVDSQNPIRIDPDAEPQPDVMVLRARPDFYEREHPAPRDVLLIVEVADTFLAYDRQVKFPLYARAGISEAWLVDLTSGSIERHTDLGEAGYSRITEVGPGESLSSTVLSNVVIAADRLLG